MDAPRPRLLERLLRLAGVSEDTARLLAATPTLGASWLAAMSVALGFAVFAAPAAVALSHRGVGRFAAFGLAAQLICLAVAGVSLVVLVAGRHRYATRLGGV